MVENTISRKRLFLDIVFFFSIFVFPWWVGAVLGIIFLFLFDFYVELVIGAFIIDSLYGFFSPPIFLSKFLLTIISVLLLLLALPLKDRLKFYSFRDF